MRSGAYQAGALLALAEHGGLPDALYGCSAGALNAAFFACDPTLVRARELVSWWADGSTHGVLAPSRRNRLRGLASAATTRSDALLDDRPLRRLLAEHVPAHDLSELAVPLTVTTTCLDCGVARHHDRGPVADVLVASCSLPGLSSPVRLPGGHLHVDGGVVCGVPLQAALDGAGPDDRVVVLDCGLAPVTGREGGCAAVPGPAGEPACGLTPQERRYLAPTESSRGVLDGSAWCRTWPMPGWRGCCRACRRDLAIWARPGRCSTPDARRPRCGCSARTPSSRYRRPVAASTGSPTDRECEAAPGQAGQEQPPKGRRDAGRRLHRGGRLHVHRHAGCAQRLRRRDSDLAVAGARGVQPVDRPARRLGQPTDPAQVEKQTARLHADLSDSGVHRHDPRRHRPAQRTGQAEHRARVVQARHQHRAPGAPERRHDVA